jgi:hypothetical protein
MRMCPKRGHGTAARGCPWVGLLGVPRLPSSPLFSYLGPGRIETKPPRAHWMTSCGSSYSIRPPRALGVLLLGSVDLLASTALITDFQHGATSLRPVWPMSHADGPTCVLASVEGAVQGQVGEVTFEQINLFDVVVSDDATLDSIQAGFPSSQAGEDCAVTGAEDLLRHPADAKRWGPSDVGRVEELPLLLHGPEYAGTQPPLWLSSGTNAGP